MATTSDTGTTRPASGHVDWELAKASGRRLVPAGPRVSAREAAAVVAELRSAAERAAAPVAETARMHAPAGASPVLIVDRGGWIDANVDSLRDMLEPVIHAMLDKRKGAVPGAGLAQSVGSKVTGGEAGALLAFLASKVLGQYDLAPNGSPRLLLVAPNILHAETELVGRPARLPPLGGAARGDPPGAVHRRAVAARPPGRLRARALAGPGARPRGARRQAAAGGAQPAGGAAQRGRRADRPVRHAGAARPDRPGHRRHVAARGARRRGHGRRRPAGHPLRRGDPRPSSSSAAWAPAPSTGCCAGCSASRPRCASTATAPCSSAAVTDPVGVDGFNAVWTSPETLPLPAEIARARRPGCRRVHGDRAGRARPDPAVAATRLAVRAEPRRRCRAGGARPRRVQRRRGLAGPRRRARRSRRRGRGLRAGARRRRPRPAGRLRRRSPRRAAATCAATWASTPSRSCRSRCARAGDGPEAAARSARYAALQAAAGGLGADRGAARAHPRRPGRAGAARPRPRAPAPGPWPVCRARRGRFARPLLGLPRVTTPRRPARPTGLDPWDDPHNADPAFRRVRARRAAGRRSSATSARASPRRSPARADLLREDADLPRRARRREARRDAGRRAAADAAALAALPRAVRTRVWRLLAVEAGAPAGALSRRARRRARRAAAVAGTGRARSTCRAACRAGASGGQVRIGAARPVRSGWPTDGCTWTPPSPSPMSGDAVDAAHMGADLETVLLTEEQIQAKLDELGRARSGRTTRARTSLLVGVLKGAVMVMADLMRALPGTAPMDWMAVSSYGSGTKSSGVVRILKDLDTDITGRHVLIVEDIIDSGPDPSWIKSNLESRGAGLGRDLHPAAQAGGRQGRDRRQVRRLRHPQRVRRRLRPRLRREVPQPARRRHPRPARLLPEPRGAGRLADARAGTPPALHC